MRKLWESRRAGFTLVELLVVISIIGILISLILVASADGVRRAEERQTQTLITKLETALTDRVDALLTVTAPINQTHRYLAAITYPDVPNSAFAPVRNSYNRRAQVIAQFDYMKAELPDVFYRNSDANYPLNFAAAPYPPSNPNGPGPNRALDFVLPLGNRWVGLPFLPENLTPPAYDSPTSYDPLSHPDTGIYGASFTAAAGLYKNLYEAAALDLQQAEGSNFNVNTKAGYNGADNGGVFGLIDDIGEVTVTPAPAKTFASYVSDRLAKHDHKTARSEMLYALLVEGQGPLGSAYNREDFTSRDVADTDGDGMPEFIDAWGQPLQFYRWPIYNGGGNQTAVAGTSGSQLGFQQYTFNQPRQLDTLDPNQLLVSVGWWAGSFNQRVPTMVPAATIPDFLTAYTGSPASPQANAFMTYFHIIIDPLAANPPANLSQTPVPNWDRTGQTRRRAYFSKFLVLSGGPDKEIGVFRLGKNYRQDVDSTLSTAFPLTLPTGPAITQFPTGVALTDAKLVNWCEGQAAPVELSGRLGTFYEDVSTAQTSLTSLYLQNNAGLDDISNQTLTSPGSGPK